MSDPMISLIGSGFDCEYRDSSGDYVIYRPNTTKQYISHSRPRMNAPQVCDSWDFVPDGFVWKVITHYGSCQVIETILISNQLKICKPIYCSCIGVEKESDWSKANDVPVIDMEAKS